jgi:hypothetical protein
MLTETELEKLFDQRDPAAGASHRPTMASRNDRPFFRFEIDCAPLSVALFDGSAARPIEDPWLISCGDKFSGIGISTLTKGPPDKTAPQKYLQSAITKLGATYER